MLQCFDLVSIFSSFGGPFLPIDCVGLLDWDFAYQNMQDIRIILLPLPVLMQHKGLLQNGQARIQQT